jgi:tetratricopeptide (TPR) repeat protein
VKLNPDDPDLYAHLGQFLATRGRFQEGIATARKGLRIDPDNLFVVKALQILYRLADDLNLSEEFGNRALQLDPEDSQNHLQAGFRMLEGKESKRARGSFLEALRLAPADDDSYHSIAHEKVRQHPFFKKGFFLSFHKWIVTGAIITPVFWWLLSLLWQPFFWMAILSALILVCAYAYTGLFHLCRWLVLRRLRSGQL